MSLRAWRTLTKHSPFLVISIDNIFINCNTKSKVAGSLEKKKFVTLHDVAYVAWLLGCKPHIYCCHQNIYGEILSYIDVLEGYMAYIAHSHGHVDYIAWLLTT
jgi:hypothetical protein